ncbi:MAG TPA: NADH-quinone oxidoreductase subunit C [Methanoregulaceae archaeon]|nr:MAG: NADH-quinone oxidoreductase subunit C [Methanolinea sp.]HON81114.1 NADH-quinone oxidoreductase subunit C [Methanoregulaceae archaeon]HPD09942.1 NADH-quinone oxidoreductase subunit C [Methanoregulaceae archaeon]HRT14867.1 NADH-quinone oxidoreductase subunit C [Methanoregulaceae archaeon]HRU30518.1 NADH-quinone oxidoreductase subunit C [Methanoregulaceae archaeon]
MTEKVLTPDQVAQVFRERFGAAVTDIRITEQRVGVRKNPNFNIWIDIDRSSLCSAIATLIDIHFPHLSVISGVDTGDAVRLIYHFTVFYGHRGAECTVSFSVNLPKDDLSVPTISGLIPGAVFSEREKQEFLGVRVTDIPDGRRLFLPDDFPDGVFPWRKDETGVPEGMINELWRSKRPVDRPAPPAEKKELCELPSEDSPAGEGSS